MALASLLSSEVQVFVPRVCYTCSSTWVSNSALCSRRRLYCSLIAYGHINGGGAVRHNQRCIY